MAQFTILKTLITDQFVVRGTDFLGKEGEVEVDGTQWAQLKRHGQFKAATAEFDDVVKAHFADISAAAERVKAISEVKQNPMGYVVVAEEVKGVQAQPALLQHLSPDSVILRILEEQGLDTEQLTWVGDRLVALEDSQAPIPFVTVELDEV